MPDVSSKAKSDPTIVKIRARNFQEKKDAGPALLESVD
jgi:hypothetical protein